MAVISSGGGATVHQFPVGGRNVGHRRFEKAATVTDIRLAPIMVVDYSNWYHEQAVREESSPQA